MWWYLYDRVYNSCSWWDSTVLFISFSWIQTVLFFHKQSKLSGFITEMYGEFDRETGISMMTLFIGVSDSSELGFLWF